MPTRLQYSFANETPYQADVAANQAALEALMIEHGLDALLITSQDRYISEYTPTPNNPRYALTGFDGSAGDGIFLRRAVAEQLGLKAPFVLFVDGRYHLQADQQTRPEQVQVEKLSLGIGIWAGIAIWLQNHRSAIRQLGFDAQRLSVAQRVGLTRDLADCGFAWESLESGEVDRAIRLPGWQIDRPIRRVPQSATGRSVADNFARLGAEAVARYGSATTCFVSGGADDLSYLLNTRGYHLPNSSSQLGYLFAIGEQVALFLPEGCERCEVEEDPASPFTVIRNDLPALERFLARFPVTQVCYQASRVNCALAALTQRVWPQAAQDGCFDAVERLRTAKTDAELAAIRSAFAKSSLAIAQTMRWAKYGEAGQRHTEYDLAVKISDAYIEQGALGLSFTSIAASGETGAVMHYGKASRERELKEGEMILLDSGAYYAEGFATDCTRVVLRSTAKDTQVQAWQKEIYTVTLKACVAGMRARLPASTTGHEVDKLVRDVVKSYGYDFAHGTGHGIGIHVHEEGIRFRPDVEYTLTAKAVASIEPGIYLNGQGGVRIENVVIVQPQPEAPEQRYFESIVFVGYDWDLVDLALLTPDEREYLTAYEQECQSRGTAVTPCPLLAN